MLFRRVNHQGQGLVEYALILVLVVLVVLIVIVTLGAQIANTYRNIVAHI